MINQHQQELRRAAAKEFIEALDQLQERLQFTDGQPGVQSIAPPNPQPAKPEPQEPLQFDLHAFEQAVADIEEYIQQKQAGE
ncbi:hypothetical protein K9N68_23285 [Kovacikia minuta CCNUW1]|uniref:hypothetical protein n=1 Tax=Kovacikia minuta TaxID=2931930 RepID=UPI001CC93767|nr:hypothetical protein [Kovacikia minuta]UBF24586.1 hypothetical protein K9N68_23285 [Kovacikia minuta CCNUW1]